MWGRTTKLAAFALSVLTAGTAQAGTLYIANLAGANEIPPTTVPYSGTGFLILNDSETQATVTASHNITVATLTGSINRGTAGLVGPIVFSFNAASPVGPLLWTISAADVANLKNAGLYMNLPTQGNPFGAIRSTFTRVSFVPSAISAGQLDLATALDNGGGYASDLDQILRLAATSAVRTQVLNDLSNRTAYAQTRQQIEAMADFGDSLFAQIETANAAAGEFDAFVKGGKAFGKRGATFDQAGAKIARSFVIGGLSHEFVQSIRIGASIGYANADDMFTAGSGNSKTKTTAFYTFAAGNVGSIVVAAAAGYGWNTVNAARAISSFARTANSSSQGDVWSAALKASRPVALDNDASLMPYALIDAQRAAIDAYAESGAGSASMNLPARTSRNLAVEAGAGLIVPMPLGPGMLTARINAGVRQLLDDGGGTFTVGFVGTPVSFATHVAGPGRSQAHVGASMTATLSQYLIAGLSYRGLASSRMTSHILEGRVALKI